MKWESMLDVTSDVESHPARGAWIEIIAELTTQFAQEVAPRKGCVD